MEKRTSNKTLIIIIAILLIANIATIGLMLFGKQEAKPADKDDRKNAMRNYLKDSLKFSEAQLVQFDTIKSRHREQVKVIFDSIRASKTSILKQLGRDGFPDSSLAGAAQAAAGQQKLVELQMLKHLKDVRTLCSPDQLKSFDTGFYKIMNRPPPDDKKKEK
jgi:hypothetical protein